MDEDHVVDDYATVARREATARHASTSPDIPVIKSCAANALSSSRRPFTKAIFWKVKLPTMRHGLTPNAAIVLARLVSTFRHTVEPSVTGDTRYPVIAQRGLKRR
jgi:hypothetical protein